MTDNADEPAGLTQMLAAYIEAALWSTMDESTPQGGNPLDDNYDADDLAPETRAAMAEECRCFLCDNAADIGDQYAQAGFDFWLTRNGHGTGFWDGRWPADAGQRLTAAAKVWGSVDLYVHEGRIYQP